MGIIREKTICIPIDCASVRLLLGEREGKDDQKYQRPKGNPNTQQSPIYYGNSGELSFVLFVFRGIFQLFFQGARLSNYVDLR